MDTKQSIDSETSETSKQYGVIFRFTQKFHVERVLPEAADKIFMGVVGAMLSLLAAVMVDDGWMLVASQSACGSSSANPLTLDLGLCTFNSELRYVHRP